MAATTLGVPTTDEIARVVDSEIFGLMRQFNDAFLTDYAETLAYYKGLWVEDPLHNWSRQWEYPFVYEHLQMSISAGHTVLDAGAGATFFPFFLATKNPTITVEAVDSDAKLEDAYHHVGHPGVSFGLSDIMALHYPDNYFDGAYSISVLEHVTDPKRALFELARVLKPSAPLVLTMDLSLDGRSDIPVDQALQLLESASDVFEPAEHPDHLQEEILRPDILSTSRVSTDLLPWRWTVRRRLRAMFRERRPPWRPTPLLTVYGTLWRRRVDDLQ